jgi:hypothetical protein
MKNLFVTCFSLLLLASACSTDFEVNAPYEEKTVVYCLLDGDSAFQTARITRTFLTETNALDAAQDSSKSEYAPNEIQVRLRPTSGSTLNLERQVFTGKAIDGDFYAPNQIIYRNANSTTLNASANYTLQVIKNEAVIAESEPVSLVQNFTPELTTVAIQLRRNEVRFTPTHPFRSGTGTIKLYANFTVKETFLDNRPEEIHQFRWDISADQDVAAGGRAAFEGGSLVGILNSAFDTNNTRNNFIDKREISSITLTVVAASPEFRNYLLVRNNASAFTQTKPIYTNVKNGLGLVASRRTKRLNLRLANSIMLELGKGFKYTH